MKSTIKDVAKRASVSISTVSLVINEKSNVSKATRKKVLAAMKELNYTPNRSAQRLAGKLKGNVGFILSEDHFTRAEPFYTRIFLGTEFEAHNYNTYILLTVIKNIFNGERDVPRFLRNRDVDGVIIAGRVPSALIDYIQELKIAVVYIDFLPKNRKGMAVLIDNVDGGFQAVEHLISRNRTRIAYIAGEMDHPSMQGRFRGYQNALTKYQVPIEQSLIVTNPKNTTFKNGYKCAKKLLENTKDVDAIFAANDAMALGCLRYLTEVGIKISEQIAVVGFDDVEACVQTHPTLTTIHVEKEEMGILAIKKLMEAIHSGKTTNIKSLVPATLIIREST